MMMWNWLQCFEVGACTGQSCSLPFVLLRLTWLFYVDVKCAGFICQENSIARFAAACVVCV